MARNGDGQAVLRAQIKQQLSQRKLLESAPASAGSNQAEILKSVDDLVELLEKKLKSIREHKTEFIYSVIGADIPMCFAFGCLLLFLLIHPIEHRAFDSYRALLLRNNWQPQYFLHVPKQRIETLDIWKSKEYFVGGAGGAQACLFMKAKSLARTLCRRERRETPNGFGYCEQ